MVQRCFSLLVTEERVCLSTLFLPHESFSHCCCYSPAPGSVLFVSVYVCVCVFFLCVCVCTSMSGRLWPRPLCCSALL